MKAIKLETAGGQIIHIEVSNDISSPGRVEAGGRIAGGKKVAQKIQELTEVGDSIAEVCRTLQDQIRSRLATSKPNELTLEFGVTLAGELGIPLITKGSAEGTFLVTAKWEFK